MKSFNSIFLFLLLGLFSCKNQVQTDFQSLPAITERGYNMVIEIPAGTNHKIEINKQSGAFEVDQENGKDRVIDFLPYPGNYGFIPSTLMDKSRGGDGDALDVLLIGESLPTGSVIEIKPIASLMLKDRGENDTKIIAVPADSSLQVINATTFADLSINYPTAKNMIEDWFTNYKGYGKIISEGWKDEVYAEESIKKWMK